MGLSELKRVLQLLLGCAMKSEVPVRERHVSIIQSLPVAEQTELMEYIQVSLFSIVVDLSKSTWIWTIEKKT